MENIFHHKYVPQNKASFDSNQLAKFFVSAQKSMPTIQTFSSRTDGTIVMRRPRGSGWDPKPVVGMDGDNGATPGSRSLATCVAHVATAAS